MTDSTNDHVTKPASIGHPTGRNYGGLSSVQRKAQRKQQFLDAGLELFGTIGYRATTVRAVCREAKLTDRYFYESFGSLEALAMAVYEHCMTNLTKSILAEVKASYETDQQALKALRAGLNRYFEILEEPRIARVCMVELEGISPEVDKLYNSYIQSYCRILIGLAEFAYPTWNIPADEKAVLGISLIGALRQSATHWLFSGYEIPRETMVEGSLKLYSGLVPSLDQ